MLDKLGNSLTRRIVEDLQNTNIPLWFPDLCREVADVEWKRLAKSRIKKGSYGTARLLHNSAEAPLVTARSIHFLVDHDKEVFMVPIEVLPTELLAQYNENGVAFYDEVYLSKSKGNEIASCVHDAFRFVGLVPSLSETVRTMVQSIHVIEPSSDEYDVSFSEPHIPFSIFISVPRTNSEIHAVRVAEGIVHESMHLLLTLIGKSLGLVTGDQEGFYSPWKRQMRTTEGLLHGAYVFRALHDFFSIVLRKENLSSIVVRHLEHRRREIEQQINDVRSLVDDLELSEAGRLLVGRLVEEIRSMPDRPKVVFDEMARH